MKTAIFTITERSRIKITDCTSINLLVDNPISAKILITNQRVHFLCFLRTFRSLIFRSTVAQKIQ